MTAFVDRTVVTIAVSIHCSRCPPFLILTAVTLAFHQLIATMKIKLKHRLKPGSDSTVLQIIPICKVCQVKTLRSEQPELCSGVWQLNLDPMINFPIELIIASQFKLKNWILPPPKFGDTAVQNPS